MPIFHTVELDATLQYTTIIVSVGLLVSAMECLHERDLMADNSLLSWEVNRTQGSWGISGVSAKLAEFFFKYENFIVLLCVRFFSALLLLLLSLAGFTIPLVVLLAFFTTMAINLRSPYGLDGAYQMTLIILAAVALQSIFSDSGLAREFCIAFIAIQAILSYVVSGYWKLMSKEWRNGTGIVGVFSTSIYGHPTIYRMLSSSRFFALSISWGIIVWECTFPLLFLDQYALYFYLAVGVMFHIMTGVFMGLNGFVLAFIATYPSIAYFHHKFHSYIFA